LLATRDLVEQLVEAAAAVLVGVGEREDGKVLAARLSCPRLHLAVRTYPAGFTWLAMVQHVAGGHV
jgi:hypothetical protein